MSFSTIINKTSHKAAQNNRYIIEVNGLRGLAILMVFVNHLYAQSYPGGFLGVDIFFVVSGFVITLSVSSKKLINSLFSWSLSISGELRDSFQP